jgi:hypothetical protein
MTRYDALTNSPMAENRPTPETAKLLREELLFQRATQTYLWALPLINTLGMKVGSEKAFGAGYNVLPVWKKRLDAKAIPRGAWKHGSLAPCGVCRPSWSLWSAPDPIRGSSR